MPKRVRFAVFVAVLVTALAVLNSRGALAQEGTFLPQHSDAEWSVWYWDNTNFSGTPVLEGSESSIDHNWGTGGPGPEVGPDHFSARWARYFDTPAGVYRITATSDDGIRVWVDNRAEIDQWTIHSERTFTRDVNLEAGHHLVVVEYFEAEGLAVAKASFGPVSSGSIRFWRGEYFNNPGLSGAPALVRDDERINFGWGTGSPAGQIQADNFSARWTRTLDLPAGNYRFSMTVDDGGRLWVNNHLLIDSWKVQSERTYTGDIYLPGGQVGVKMEYYEAGGLATARLNWAREGENPPPPESGEVLVEDGGIGFSRGGSATGWHYAPEGSGGRLTWTWNNDWARPNYNWARWYPQFGGPGRYEVYVFIPERYTTTGSANYWVSHSGGYTKRVVNQSAHGSQWVSLGTYWFRGTNGDYVSLSDVTGERFMTRLIAFDAVKFVPR